MLRARIPLLFISLFLAFLPALAQPADLEQLAERQSKETSPEEDVDIFAELAYNYVWDDANYAYELAQKGLRIADSVGYQSGRGRCLSEAGLALLYMGFTPEALEYLFDALPIVQEEGDPFWIFTTLSSLAYVQWDQDEYEEALSNFRDARKHVNKLDADNFTISLLSDIGETFLQLNQNDSAFHYIQQAYSLSLETRDTFQLAVTGNQFAIVNKRVGSIEDALKACRSSIYYASFANWNPRRNYLTMAQIHDQLAQLDSVIFYAQKSIKTANEGAFVDASSIDAYTLLAEAFEQKRRPDSAMVYLRKGIETNAMVVNTEKTKRIQGMDFERQLNQAKIEQARREATMEANLSRQRLAKNAGFAGLALVLIFSTILLNRFQVTRSQKRDIETQKDRADKLLLNILPSSIAEELKHKGKAESIRFDEVTVLFTDFVNFTKISEDWSAEEVVQEIHECFSEFDRIIVKHGVEKIKTIGDSYMCAGGIPSPRSTHALDIIRVALEFQQFMKKRNIMLREAGRKCFEIRIGIHSGPVVAGIVGVSKFAYDIWGNTVNTASRMETFGVPGKINISEDSYQLLKNTDWLKFSQREKMEVKGKGAMQMYFVNHRDYTESEVTC
jgi:class 3 adenylate cyclase